MKSNPLISFGKTFLLAALLLATINISLFKLMNFDLWLHLKTGQFVVKTGSIPQTDPFSYTARNAPWVAHEWLFGVIFYSLYTLVHAWGLVLIQALLVISAVFLILTSNQEADRNYWVSIPCLFAALLLSRFRFLLGPDLFTLLFLAFYYFAYSRWRSGGKWWGLSFPLTMVFWINVHAGSFFGLIFLLIFLSGEVAARYLRWGKEPPLKNEQLLTLLMIFLATLAATLVNPYGYKVLLLPFTLKTMQQIPHLQLNEWAPFTFQENPWFFIYLSVVSLWLLGRFRRLTPGQWLLYGFYAFLAISARRGVLEWAMLTVPLLESSFAGLFKQKATAAGWLALIYSQFLGLTMIILSAYVAFKPDPVFQFGLGAMEDNMPIKAVDFLEEQNIGGQMFNSYRWGGYLMWRLFPRRLVFLDGRAELYQKLFSYRSRLSVPQIIKSYNVDYLLVDYQPSLPFSVDFEPDSRNWALVFWDDAARVYLRRKPKFQGVIKRCEYKLIRPNDNALASLHVEPQDFPLLEREILRGLQESPYNFRAQIFLAGFRYLQKQPAAGRELFNKALRARPYNTSAYFSLANLLHYLKDEPAALEYLQLGLRKEPNSWGDYQLLGNIYASLKKYDQAIAAYQKGLTYHKDDYWLNYFLGHTYLTTNQYPLAEKFLTKAWQIDPRNSRTWPSLAQLYAYQKNYPQAIMFYELTQNINPQP